jgi:predicted protein tyrosine phosphatase
MKVDVYSREHACALEPTPNTVVISITDPPMGPLPVLSGTDAPLKAGWDDILRLQFHDVVRIPSGMQDVVVFCIADADVIHAFIAKYPDKDYMIHCAAGVSRSVAVGSFMREIHDADLHLHEIHTDEHCNSRVRRALLDKYWRAQLTK